MDLPNAFFIFNLVAIAAVLAGLFLLRENVAATVANVRAATKPRTADLNFAGTAGAAASLVLLTTVGALFL